MPPLSTSLLQPAGDSVDKTRRNCSLQVGKTFVVSLGTLGNLVQALCFAAKGQWQGEELGRERKHRWLPGLVQEPEGVLLLKAGLAVLAG